MLSVLALKIFDLIRGERKEDTEKYSTGKTILGTVSVLAVAVVALLVRVDYTIFAVVSVFLFYVLKDKKQLVRNGVGVAFLALTRTMGYYCTTGLSIIPLLLYNGKKGRGYKWFFYVFYPGHLLLLYVLKRILSGQITG